MSGGRAKALGLALALGVLASGGAFARAGPPEVAKVEPPSWWAGHSLDPVRLLVRGKNLGGARVEAAGPGLQAGSPQVSAAGTFLFLDVSIDPRASPGPRHIRIRTPGGAAEVPLELLAPLPREGRFGGFSPDDVIYLVLPDRFANGDPANDDPPVSRGLFDRTRPRYYHGGDLQGLIDHLPYLRDLGVTALWLTPWYDNANRLNERERYDNQAITDYHGYGATDFYAVEEHFGTLGKLRELVEAAHARGLKVIQDQVANHTGPYHPWVAEPPTPTWYNGSEARHLANPWQIWTLQDPHATPETQRATLQGWFIDILPDLNQDDPETARYLIQNALWWVGATGLDGIRQDTVPYVPRRFWRDWTAALRKEYPRLSVVGELSDADPALVSFFQGGATRFDGIDTGLYTLFDFPLYEGIRDAFARGRPLPVVAKILAHDHLYPNPAPLVTFVGLHDKPRFMSEPGATAPGLELAFTFLMTARGMPLVYYGDEIGMTGGDDPDNRRDFPGGWKEDAHNAFTAGGRTPDEQSVFAHLQRLLRLRAELAPLRRGSLVNLALGEHDWAYARLAGGEAVVMVLNNGGTEADLDIPAGPAGLREGALLEERLQNRPPLRVENGRLRVVLPAWSGAIYAPRPKP